MTPPPLLTENDYAAMRLAIERCRRAGHDMDMWLARDGLEKTGEFAAYSSQMASLHLKPWEYPPSLLLEVATLDDPAPDPDLGGIGAGLRLLRTMLKLGVSRRHPSPLEAVAEARKRRSK